MTHDRHVRRRRASAGRGFSLAELLLAIFILGIGVISVAALFPAGIAQQRQSADDATGPIVAESALAVLRTKLRPEYFSAEVVTGAVVAGDFPWTRPGFVIDPDGATLSGVGEFVPGGSLVIFNDGTLGTSAITDSEVPWSLELFGNAPPPIVVTQRERYWPMSTAYGVNSGPARPQYVWDAMFRRFQGRVQVAIFVYRVGRPGGESGPYVVAPNPSNPSFPPLPIALDLSANPWNAGGADGNVATLQDNAVVPNTAPGAAYDPLDDAQAWQRPGQWILDQNNNVHRVAAGRRNQGEGPVRLAAPLPAMPDTDVYVAPGAATLVWFLPAKDQYGNTLSPVYVTVREL